MKHSVIRRRQRGISLFIVMVMVLLSTLLVMWASRTALFNEMVAGNDSDYQRAFEAAQAVVRDAEFDIRGTKSDGVSPCKADAGFVGCRPLAGGKFLPQDSADYQDLSDALRNGTPSCDEGICVPVDGKLPASAAEFWDDAAALAAMKAKAARYGQHTGARAAGASNPLLATTGAARAWYWIEVLPYNVDALAGGAAAQKFAPDVDAPFIFRITGIAEGLKGPASRAVVQTVFVRRRVSS